MQRVFRALLAALALTIQVWAGVSHHAMALDRALTSSLTRDLAVLCSGAAHQLPADEAPALDHCQVCALAGMPFIPPVALIALVHEEAGETAIAAHTDVALKSERTWPPAQGPPSVRTSAHASA